MYFSISELQTGTGTVACNAECSHEPGSSAAYESECLHIVFQIIHSTIVSSRVHYIILPVF